MVSSAFGPLGRLHAVRSYTLMAGAGGRPRSRAGGQEGRGQAGHDGHDIKTGHFGQSSSGGAGFPAASALIKPEERISRIRLARILSVGACGSAARRSQQAQTKVVHKVGIERPVLGDTVTALTSVPAWPFDPASISVQRLSAAVRYRTSSPMESGIGPSSMADRFLP